MGVASLYSRRTFIRSYSTGVRINSSASRNGLGTRLAFASRNKETQTHLTGMLQHALRTLLSLIKIEGNLRTQQRIVHGRNFPRDTYHTAFGSLSPTGPQGIPHAMVTLASRQYCFDLPTRLPDTALGPRSLRTRTLVSVRCTRCEIVPYLLLVPLLMCIEVDIDPILEQCPSQQIPPC